MAGCSCKPANLPGYSYLKKEKLCYGIIRTDVNGLHVDHATLHVSIANAAKVLNY